MTAAGQRQTVELDETEEPFLAQLEAMGWTHLPGSALTPEDREPGAPLLTGRLKKALRRINKLPGQSGCWMGETDLKEVAGQLLRLSHRAGRDALKEVNSELTGLLHHGVPLRGPDGKDRHAQLIDWETDSPHNEFLAVSQLRVSTPGGASYEVPDIVLFVNGIPLAVIECKSQDLRDPLGDAIRDLRAYTGNPVESDDRPARNLPAGIPALFAAAQLLVAASGTDAALGTFEADERHYARWHSAEPDHEDDSALHRALREAQQARTPGEAPFLGAEERVNGQHRLIAIALKPRNLLNIVRHYVIELPVKNAEGEVVKRVKTVCRHQQYRAVEKIVERLRTKRSPLDAGAEDDERGGVIWHTQGSGKSLTMAFLARRLHQSDDPVLNQFTVLVVTDRTQLQEQLHATVQLSESPSEIADSQADVESLLESAGKPGGRRVIFAMIQKYLGRVPGLVLGDEAKEERNLAEEFRQSRKRIEAGEDPGEAADPLPDEAEVRRREFRLCSESSRVLVLIDEAHRSHSSVLHACLRDAVPNAARIGFTGTPILKGRRKLTREIFGPTIDTYRMDEAERDMVVVPVEYEGRTGPANVKEGEELDAKFINLLAPLTERQKRSLRGRWAHPTGRDVSESVPMIRAKAKDMLEHYVLGPLRYGYKAQVAAVSREAVVLYRSALSDARAELLEKLVSFDPERLRGVAPSAYTHEDRVLLAAWHQQALLRRIDFVPVISAGKERSSGRWREWTDEDRQQDHVARFLQRLPALAPDNPWAVTRLPEPDPLPAGRTGQPQGRTDGLNPWSGSGTAEPSPAELPPIAFLIVKSMLLTGFDAPIEQVLYLDRPIQDAELLQAVARVNRPYPGKKNGLVVDYYGVLADLRLTLAAYRDEPEGKGGGMRTLGAAIPEMKEAGKELSRFLRETLGITDLSSREGRNQAVLALKDDRDRLTFDRLLGDFLSAQDRVLPHQAALGWVAEAQRWTVLQKRARRLYRDAPNGDFSLRAYGRQVRAMIADHLELPEITQEIVPIALNDPGFDAAVERIGNTQLAAAEQAHGLRRHLEQHERRERPEVYDELSKALDRVLREFDGRWAEMKEQLKPLIERAREQADDDPALVGASPGERRLYAQISDCFNGTDTLPDVPPETLRELSGLVYTAVTDRVTLTSFGPEERYLTALESDIFQALRRALRAAGLRAPVEPTRSVARRLAGHVQEFLSLYQGRGGASR
ncbi:type I restriction endonuclease subunit R [Streptomyces sp. A73]|nr:type I restriction endonuclease subunit R [Streptomyces sp. A73]